MQVDLVCIGSELLTGLVENTNATYLSRRLHESGWAVRSHRIVGDTIPAIQEAVLEGLKHSEAVLCTGGLGPTADDLTREAVAGALGLALESDPGWLKKLEHFFTQRGYSMPKANRKQALVPAGAILLDNPHGTAPGLLIPAGRRLLFLLPGPPAEMCSMFEAQVLPRLLERTGREIVATRLLKCAGLGESVLEQRLQGLGRWDNPELSLLARGLEVRLQLKARGAPAEVARLLDEKAARIRAALAPHLYGENEETLAGAVAARLSRQKLTLALAESCTGGLVADTITDVPGSSLFLLGGVIAYSIQAKVDLLRVSPALIETEGVVSEAVALAMARGVRRLFGAKIGVGTTGVAGPEGGTTGTPVGTVYLAAVGPFGESCRLISSNGSRRMVKTRAAQTALYILWEMLEG